METRTIPLGKGQRLADVFPEGIPTNTIVNKTVCGIGATTLEIQTKRHSIIVEPNVPDYPYQKRITLLQTNNVFTLFADVLNRIPAERKVCIFFDSTSGISRLIDRLDIKKDSSIYCSSDAAQRLISKGYNANDALQTDDELSAYLEGHI